MTQPNNPEINRPRTGLFSRVAVVAGAGALVIGACGRDNDNEAMTAPSVAEQIVVGLDDIDAGYCADTFGTEEFSYGLDSEGNVLETGEEADRLIERTYVPQTIGALLPFNPEKAKEDPDSYRLYSDGVTTQLEGKTLDEVTTNVFKKICEDPFYTEHMIAGFGNITGTSGKLLREEANPWMSDSVEVADEIAENQFWNFDNLDLTAQERQTLSSAEIVKRMNQHETRAALMIELMDRYFTPTRFVTDATTSYHIALSDAEVSEDNSLLPELTDENPNYSGNFIVFEYRNKDGRCIEVGLNLGDGRFSEFVDGVCIQEGDITTTTVINTVPEGTTTTIHIPGETTTTTQPDVETTTTTEPEEETTTTTEPEEETTTTTEPEEETTTTIGDKEPTGTEPQGGGDSGGDPEHGDDPGNDSDDDGYGPGDRELADRDGDGIHNSIDQCPDQAEVWNGFEDGDGCPDTLPEIVITTTSGVVVTSAPPTTSPQPTSTTEPAPATTSVSTQEGPAQGTVAPLPGFDN